jgi:hypothetical protein
MRGLLALVSLAARIYRIVSYPAGQRLLELERAVDTSFLDIIALSCSL